MKFVVDTSVAIKWFVPEQNHQAALALPRSGTELVAPDLLFAEFANALRKKLTRGEITLDQAQNACDLVPSGFARIIPTLSLFRRSLQIALLMDHWVYDCVFLACAEQEGFRAVTADGRLVEKADKSGFRHLVCSLEEALLMTDKEKAAPGGSGRDKASE